jgi:tRNA pseudouridine38-40 synthase
MAQVSVFLDVAYDGAGFCGFARQGELPTVQGALEGALTIALRRQVELVGAGRTDAGVHATGQVVSFPADSDELPDIATLARSVDALTPSAIGVSRARIAVATADARFSALARSYRYRMAAGGVRPILGRDLVWCVPRMRARVLDLDAMRAGASQLVGEHDFRSFCVRRSGAERGTVRRIDRLEFGHEELAGCPILSLEIEGRAFLHSMVRIIVGTLVQVGRGVSRPEWVGEALAARDRADAGPTAPAHGLVLESVSYPESIFLDDRGSEADQGPDRG